MGKNEGAEESGESGAVSPSGNPPSDNNDDSKPEQPEPKDGPAQFEIPSWIRDSAVVKRARDWLMLLPEPCIERTFPYANNTQTMTESPDIHKEVTKIGRSVLWTASMFGIGTFIGQLRCRFPITQVVKRSLMGAGVGTLALVGGGMVRDLHVDWIASLIEASENLVSARFRQMDRQNQQSDGELAGETPQNENARAIKAPVNPDRLEEHETIGLLGTILLTPFYLGLIWPLFKWLVFSTRVLTAGVYPYFLMRLMHPSDHQVAYGFAVHCFRSFTAGRAWALGLAFWVLGMDLPEKGAMSQLRMWAVYLAGIFLVYRNSRAARRYLKHITSDHTVKSSAQYFLDSTRK